MKLQQLVCNYGWQSDLYKHVQLSSTKAVGVMVAAINKSQHVGRPNKRNGYVCCRVPRLSEVLAMARKVEGSAFLNFGGNLN
jgi:hypothetical protein